MEESKKITVYTWKYDNGAWGYAVKQKKGGWLEQNGYTTKRKVQECYKEYKKKPDTQSVKKKKIDVPVGLSYIKERYKSVEKNNREINGMEAMLDLLNSCGTTPDVKREMLRFVASVLAGYCARVSAGEYMNFLPPMQRRAPIIIVKQAPFAGEVLERVIRSLALNTTQSTDAFRLDKCLFDSGKGIRCKYASVLPKNSGDEKITDRAFLKLEGHNKRMLPQYRDTTLLIYGWFLRGRDSGRLQLINRWVSMVVYGASVKQVVTTPVEIDGKDLAKTNCQWDIDDVQLAVIRYARYVSQKSDQEEWKEMLRAEFARYNAMIDSFNQNSESKIKVAERYQISMQLLALHLFLKACAREQELEQDQAAKIENKWCTVLLPGCKIPGTSDFVEQEELKEENNIKEEFESVLVKIFKEGFPTHFYISKEAQEGKDERPDMWGDIGLAPTRDPHEGVYYVRFSKSKFKELLDEFSIKNGGEWLYKKVEKMGLDYIVYRNKMRVKAIDVNEPGVAFLVDGMTFLPQELRDKLNDAGCRAEERKNSSISASKT